MIINDIRDEMIDEIVDIVNKKKANKRKKNKYDIIFRTTITYILRMLIIRIVSENNNISNENAKKIILGKLKYENRILNLVPLDNILEIEYLKSIDKYYDVLKNYDISNMLHYIVNEVYERTKSRNIKKSLGQYFTEKKYIDLLLDRIPLDKDKKILEPAVGGGSFLIEAFNKIKDKNYKLSDDKINKNLCGVDIDEFCVNLSKINILFNQNKISYERLKFINIVNRNFLLHDFKEKFDVIIGNPPYNAKMDAQTKEIMKEEYPEVTRLNTAELFIRKSFDLLKDEGWLGFVIPNSFLRVDTYKGIRNLLINHCTIKSVINIGQAFEDVGLETVIIIAQKVKSNDDQYVEIIPEIKNEEIKPNKVKYNYLKKWKIVPIYINESLGKIAEKMESGSIKLTELAQMPRGLGESSKSDYFEDNPFLKDDDLYIPILRGQDIGRYLINNPEIYISTHKVNKVFKSKKDMYISKKILVQNVAKRIVASLDEEGYKVLDTINMVILKDKYLSQFNYLYLLSILNSELINFYFQNTINNRSKLTIHMDEPYLGQIPIKNCENQDLFIKKAINLINLNKELINFDAFNLLNKNYLNEAHFIKLYNNYERNWYHIKSKIKTEKENIDNLIYGLYNINTEEKQIVKNNLGTNPIREYKYSTLFKQRIRIYKNKISDEKVNLINKSTLEGLK